MRHPLRYCCCDHRRCAVVFQESAVAQRANLGVADSVVFREWRAGGREVGCRSDSTKREQRLGLEGLCWMDSEAIPEKIDRRRRMGWLRPEIGGFGLPLRPRCLRASLGTPAEMLVGGGRDVGRSWGVRRERRSGVWQITTVQAE